VTWNIQVYGPKKYSNQNGNNINVARFIAQVLASQNANVVVLQEIMAGVAQQVAFTIANEAAARMGAPWNYTVIDARPGGDRESCVFLWRDSNDAAANFRPVLTAAGNPAQGVPANDFPSKWAATGGRRAAYKVFRTNDTATNFVVTNYHAPANAFAGIGPDSVAAMTELYSVTNMGAVQPVPGRLLGGDWNLDYNSQSAAGQGYPWLTNPVPAPPPPVQWGQGAGAKAAVSQNTRFGDYQNAESSWGPDPGNWPDDQSRYLHNSQAYDNIFYANPGGIVNGRVMTVLYPMTTTGPLRDIALRFDTSNNAFPYSAFFPAINIALSQSGYAFLLYRYAVSDHLPVSVTLTM
jgi:hypothetical protein